MPKDVFEVFDRKIVITGASGFIGKWLLASWITAREEFGAGGHLICMSRNPAAYPECLRQEAVRAGVGFRFGDVRSLTAIEIPEVYGVIHGATPTTLGVTQAALTDTASTVIDGQRAVLEFSQKNKVQRMLFLSSGAVYGSQPSDSQGVPEDDLTGPDPLNPLMVYHEAKRLAETLGAVAAMDNSFDFITARLFAFLAPLLPLDAHFAAGNFIRDALRGRHIQLTGSGRSIRSYQYGTDLVSWLWTILKLGQGNRAYNVGSDEEISIEQLAQLIIRTSGKPLEILRPRDVQVLKDSRYIPNVSRARHELQLHNFISIEAGVERTLSWWSIP